mmetsp:Transcript_345/g.1156  ORF Transcript_345/g.1156 Transcript_345/m.1156 type:complete len:213 (-) Transcript_345:1326-1964(-)
MSIPFLNSAFASVFKSSPSLMQTATASLYQLTILSKPVKVHSNVTCTSRKPPSSALSRFCSSSSRDTSLVNVSLNTYESKYARILSFRCLSANAVLSSSRTSTVTRIVSPMHAVRSAVSKARGISPDANRNEKSSPIRCCSFLSVPIIPSVPDVVFALARRLEMYTFVSCTGESFGKLFDGSLFSSTVFMTFPSPKQSLALTQSIKCTSIAT